MSRTVTLRCRCGALRGAVEDITPAADARSVCYCDDCQIFALHLGTPGVLDERGGTDACLLAPAQVRIEQGGEHVRCLRLSPKGLYRFYAACCNTPLGNAVGPKIPVVILVHSCMDHAADGRSRDEDLGSPTMRIMGRFAKGGVPQGAHPKVPLFKFLPGLLGHLARTYFGRKSKPSPFWNDQGELRAPLTLIDKSEREALRARVHAAANLVA